MTTNQRPPSVVYDVLDLAFGLLRLYVYGLGVIAVGCILFVMGEGFVEHPFIGSVILAVLVAFGIWSHRANKRAKIARMERKAALYRRNDEIRAQNFPELVFEEHREQWEKEIAA